MWESCLSGSVRGRRATEVWKRSCGTAAKAGGKQRKQTFSCSLGRLLPTRTDHLRKNTRPLLFRFKVGIFNSILEFTRKHRPHRPNCPSEEYLWSDYDWGGNRVGVRIELNCAQIVPVKVKYFQMVPNETKSQLKNWNRINMLKINEILIFWI